MTADERREEHLRYIKETRLRMAKESTMDGWADRYVEDVEMLLEYADELKDRLEDWG